MERTKRYPECFPGNFETEILPKGAKEESRAGLPGDEERNDRQRRFYQYL